MTYASTVDDFSPFGQLRELRKLIKPSWGPTAQVFRQVARQVEATQLEAPQINAVYLESWARIRAFAGLSEGWKGPGSAPVSQQAIDDAERFTKATFSARTVAPSYIGAAADGELIVSWRGAHNFIEASFSGDGLYSYYAKIGEQEFFGDDLAVADGLAADLRPFIEAN